jgi:two-component system sensor histidine kinase KdpD
VTDDGPGIPAAALPHLFKPFYRAPGDQKPRGSGLGLAVARGLIEAHGGRIWAENREEGGARFAFTLPLGEQPVAVA